MPYHAIPAWIPFVLLLALRGDPGFRYNGSLTEKRA